LLVAAGRYKVTMAASILAQRWFLLLLLLALTCHRGTTGFSPTSQRVVGKNGALQPFPKRSSTAAIVFATKDPEDPSDNEKEDAVFDSTPPTSSRMQPPNENSSSSSSMDESKSKEQYTAPAWLRSGVFALLSGTSAVFSTLCLGMSLGLVLNLFGYGYMFVEGQGLRIDTLPQIRQEAQFRREIQKSMAEAARDQTAKIALQQQQEDGWNTNNGGSTSMISSSNLANVVQKQSSASSSPMVWSPEPSQEAR